MSKNYDIWGGGGKRHTRVANIAAKEHKVEKKNMSPQSQTTM
jgi:hypothetical protein